MKNLLRINSSIFSDQSVSNQLLDKIVEQFQEKFGNINRVERDLAKEGVPHLDADWITAINTPVSERTDDQVRMAAYSDTLIQEIMDADTVMIGVPMYNFGVSSALKAWFDHIARAGVTFRYTENGPEGLLKGKKAIIVTTRGGLHKGQPSDTQMPFVNTFLAFVGIEDVETIFVEGLNMGEELKEKGLNEAEQQIKNLLVA